MARAEEQLLTVDLRLRDQLTGGLGAAKAQLAGLDASVAKTQGTLGGFSTSLGGIAKAAAGAFVAFKAIDVASDFFAGGIRGAIEEEAGIKRLTASLLANVPAWDGQTAAIERTIKARQALGFADDEQRDSLARVAAATKDINQALAIQATAMDLARFKGIDLASATDALIRIEGGQFRALKGLGIELRANATQTEALAAVQKVAAGQAQAYSRETAGALAAAGVAVQELSEDFGKLAAGPIRDLANFVRGDLIPGLGNLGNAIGGIEGAATIAGAALTIKLVPGLYAAAAGFTAVELGALASAKAIGIASAAFLATPFAVFIAGTEAANVAEKALLNTKQQGILSSIRSGEAFDRETSALYEVTGGAEAAAAATQTYIAAERGAATAAAALAVSTVGLTDDTAALTAATQAGAAAMLEARGKTLEAAAAAAELAKWLDLGGDSAAEANNNLLDFASGANTAANEANDAANEAKELQAALAAIERRITIDILYRASTQPFINPNLPGTGDANRANAFSSGVDPDGPDALKQANDNFLARDRLAKEAAAREQAIREAAASKAQQAADQRLSDAKRRANEEANAYEKALGKAFDNAKRTANSLFDTLHSRHVQAIRDAETLAQKQHSGALQLIADTLKAQLAVNAAPVTAAEKALNDRQQAQSRRGLVESLQGAREAAQANTDPKAAEDLNRALRNATEALENFDAAAQVARLTEVQKTQDAKANAVANAATAKADADLAAAKAQTQKDLDAETVAAAKRKKDFEAALDKLQRADLKAGKSPAEVKADIDKLGERFGITTDKFGFHHIEDPLVRAIKSITIPAPIINLAPVFNAIFRVGAKDVAAALASQSSPTSTPMVRTGAAGRS